MCCSLKYISNSTDTCSALLSSQCTPCNCKTQGSTSTKCNESGTCSCKPNFYGTKCSNRDCQMTKWGAWTTQHGKCRCGYADAKHRTRSVRIQPVGKGKKCLSKKETGKCTMVPCDCKKIKPGYYGNRCEKRDCSLSDWTAWNTHSCLLISGVRCVYECGGKQRCTPMRYRRRSVSVKKVGDGKDCPSSRSESSSCGFSCKKNCFSYGNHHTCVYNKV